MPRTSTEELELTPAEMAARTGTTIDTLRYYEREHLIVNVARAGSGHRRYSAADVGWVEVLRCLRLSGMTIEQLRTFSALAQQGRHTEAERLRLLNEHRATVQHRIAELAQAMTVIDHKIDIYRAALADKEGP
jgi:DNA-binding transcriptional MerR regulator